MASSPSDSSSECSETASPAAFGQASSDTKQRRRPITDVQRKDLRVHRQILIQETGKYTIKQMTDFFNKKYDRVLTKSTISESLSDTFKYLDEQDRPVHPDSKRRRESKWPDLDAALFEWQKRMLTKKTTVTNEDLRLTAEKFFYKLPQYRHVEPPKFSHHWLYDYKARYKVKQYIRNDQSSATVRELLGTELENLHEQLSHYDCEDIYNMDETALLWKMSPDYSLTKTFKAGGKLEHARVTVNLACNVTGTRKLLPWIIGKAENPRCFDGSGVRVKNFPMVWRYNRKPRMTGSMFENYLRWFDMQMAGRKVCLLLIDECSSRNVGVDFVNLVSPEGLKNTTVIFLPTMTTFDGQPLDQGIFPSWKTHYRSRRLTYMCNEYNGRRDPMKSMNVLQAIRWAVAAWEADVTPTTIQNSWIESHVLGLDKIPQPEGWNNYVYEDKQTLNKTLIQMEQQIALLVQQRHIQTAMRTDKFINPDEEIVDETDEDIFESLAEAYSTGGEEREQETDEEDVDEDRIEDAEALELLSRLRLYEEQQEDGDDAIISRLNKYEGSIQARQSWKV